MKMWRKAFHTIADSKLGDDCHVVILMSSESCSFGIDKASQTMVACISLVQLVNNHYMNAGMELCLWSGRRVV